MSWLTESILVGDGLEKVLLLAAGALGGYWLVRWNRSHRHAASEQLAGQILENARREAETLLRESRVAANEEAAKQREQTEQSFSSRRQELGDLEKRLAQRENLINSQLEGIVSQERALRERDQILNERQSRLQSELETAAELLCRRKAELQKAAQLSESEARSHLLKQVEQEALKDAADLSRHILETAKSKAEDQARRILSIAIQRYAGTHTFETTTATVALQGDEIKGRIIGREGRNIRAFEAATGVTVLIDDTPNAVVLSGFDPVRREIAREAMHRLILDGRIHPTRIEEIVAAVSQEMDETLTEAGEDAFFKVGLTPARSEIVKLLGRLRFRHSFSQNILDHSVEVAHLMGLMAAEIGLEVTAAKRAGLMHDIGKAVNHEIEGSHAIVGAELIKRYGESEDVINGVASHHDEVPHTNLLGILVSAADAISASRPGARSETMSTYLKRLENLEQIGLSFTGVERCFAVQAGRELRVVVQPEKLNDDQASALARNVARKIEDELHYPGQIRVTVVRETRCVEFAK
ncbi:MAG: ribonuclease Y [Verrucomicrobia bacterium]|nr:ribonuclease Y [Verrucomicrobiota bacterium]